MAHKKKKLADLELLLNSGIESIPSLTASIKEVKNELTINELLSIKTSVEPNRDDINYQSLYQTIEKEISLRKDFDNVNINDLLSSSFYSSLSSDQTYSLSDTLKRVNLYSRYHKEELDSTDLENLKIKMREAYFAKEERTKEDLSQYRSAVATINATLQKRNKQKASSLELSKVQSNLPLVESPIFSSYSEEATDSEDWENKEIEGSTEKELRDFLRPSISTEDLIIHPEILDGFTVESYCGNFTAMNSFQMLELDELLQAMKSVDTIYQQRNTGASLAEKRALIDANNDIKAELRNIFYDHSNTTLAQIRTSLGSSHLSENIYEHQIEQLASLQEASITFDVQDTIRRQELQKEAVALAQQLVEKYTPTVASKKPAYHSREHSSLRWAFAGLGSILLLGTAYSLVPSGDVFGNESNKQGELGISTKINSEKVSFPEEKSDLSASSIPTSASNLFSNSFPKLEEELSPKPSSSKQDHEPTSQYTVKLGDSLIGIATKAYCSDLTGRKKGHCGVDTGMALGDWNDKISRNGTISLHPRDLLELPSESTMRDYVKSHERQLHHQFGKVRQHYSRR